MTPPPLPPAPPSIPAATPPPPLSVAPGFLQALRGAWLLTWRTHFTTRSLTTILVVLCALPVLTYLSATTFSDAAASVLNRPQRDLDRVALHLRRSGVPLSPAARAKLAAIFEDEYAQARNHWQSPPTNVSAVDAARSQLDQLSEWNRSLTSRVEPELETRQFRSFQIAQTYSYDQKARSLSRPHWTPSAAFYNLLVEFYFFIVLPLVCARSCGALFRDELQAETLGFLLTRPVSRPVLVVVKYICQAAWLALLLLAQALLLFFAGQLRGIPHLAAVLPLFLAAQCLAIPAWSALGLLLGLFSNRYIALALIYGFVVELGIGRIPTNINSLSLMRHLQSLLANNDELRSLFDPAITPAVWSPIAALLIGAAIFLGASVLLFTFREYHVNAEMQK